MWVISDVANNTPGPHQWLLAAILLMIHDQNDRTIRAWRGGGTTEIVGQRVVDIAEVRRAVATREAASEVTTADEVGQRRRGAVTRLRWSIAGVDDWIQLGDSPGREVGQNTCRHSRSAHHNAETYC